MGSMGGVVRQFGTRRASVAAIAATFLAAACGTADRAPTGVVAASREAASASASKENGGLPSRYVIPGAAVFPEGIAFDQRTGTIFVSSTTDGTVFRGDVRDSVLSPFLPPGADGRTTAIGLEVDGSGRLYVAGGATGYIFVYDDRTGQLVARFSSGASPTFINDIAIAKGDTAYVTDSQSPYIYRIAPSPDGTLTFTRWLDLTGTPIVYGPGFNLNGIDATPDGRYLFTVQSNTGYLFRIDTRTKQIVQVDLGGATLVNGDGIYLRGSTLYVLQNAQGILAEVRLNVEKATGTVVSRTTDPTFDYPTSLVEARGRLLVVNSQFERRNAGQPPVLPFTVSVVKAP